MRTNPDLDPDAEDEYGLVWDIGVSILVILVAVGAMWWFLGYLVEQ